LLTVLSLNARSCCQVEKPVNTIAPIQKADSTFASESAGKSKPSITTDQHCLLKTTMRRLWSDHGIFTHQFIVSYLAGINDVQAITNRLMKNQQEIGDALKPYYGKDAGQSITNLLKEHINLAAEVVKAAKAEDNKALKDADVRWHKNADEIAAVLAKANPSYWDEQEWKDMFYEHLKLVTNSVTTRLNKQWNEDVEDFDIYYTQILEMADMLSYGILHQFPKKF
jgi:hypothetical protein